MAPTILFAQLPRGDVIAAFLLITICYLILFGLAFALIRGEAKLIVLGIVTAVAAIGYSALVVPAGTIVAPTLMKIALLMVLAGIVGFLFKSGCCAAPITRGGFEEPKHD